MSVENCWINFSGQLPDEKQEQVFVLWSDGRVVISNKATGESWTQYRNTMGHRAVGWRPIQFPQPPRRPTQSEMDEAACLEAWRGQSLDFATDREAPYDFKDGWKKALYWERSKKGASQ